MVETLINLFELKQNTTYPIQGIKLYLQKNKNAKISLIAEKENVLTIKDDPRVTIYSPSLMNEEIKNSKYLNIDNEGLRVAFYLLEKNNFTNLISYSNKDEISNLCKSYLKLTSECPLFVATFANYKTHRLTCIGDLGFNLFPKEKDFLVYLKMMKNYMKKIFNKENLEFKLLNISKQYSDNLNSLLSKEEGYQGTINGNEIFKCDTDILLAHPRDLLGVISGINHGISMYDNFISDSIKNNVGLRLFSYPMMKSTFTSFHMEIDQKITSGGSVLLGFDKNIILIDLATIKEGVNVSIKLAEKLSSLNENK